MNYQQIADVQAHEANEKFKKELMAKIDQLTKAVEELTKKVNKQNKE